MQGRKLIATALILSTLRLVPASAAAQQPPVAAFKASIDLVRVSAVVRDRKGRLIENLSARDFEVLDAGIPRPITEFRRDQAGVSIALLFDVSGSMEARLAGARDAATELLGRLDAGRDEAAVFTFDTRLAEVAPFTSGLETLPEELASVVPFGETSLLDAIARTAERLAQRGERRRALVVLTDGQDNASELTPNEVSAIASAVDVPVYIVGVVSLIENPAADIDTTRAGRSPLTGLLTHLTAWTGGQMFAVSTSAERRAAARRIVDELRHQYLIAFESSGTPGWRPLVVRARDKDLVVRARSGYFAGQSRPIS